MRPHPGSESRPSRYEQTSDDTVLAYERCASPYPVARAGHSAVVFPYCVNTTGSRAIPSAHQTSAFNRTENQTNRTAPFQNNNNTNFTKPLPRWCLDSGGDIRWKMLVFGGEGYNLDNTTLDDLGYTYVDEIFLETGCENI